MRVSRFKGMTKYSFKYEGFKVWPNINLSMKVSRWDQIFIRVSRFQCGTIYTFKLERRIEGIIEGIIVGRIIYTVQASKYGCHSMNMGKRLEPKWLCKAFWFLLGIGQWTSIEDCYIFFVDLCHWKGKLGAGMPHCPICSVILFSCKLRNLYVAYPLECMLLAMFELVCNRSVQR